MYNYIVPIVGNYIFNTYLFNFNASIFWLELIIRLKYYLLSDLP